MDINVLLKHDPAGEVTAYTGPSGELVLNDDARSLHIQDGETAGGYGLSGTTTESYSIAAPTVTAPLNNATGVGAVPTLQTGSFNGNGNHVASYWQVATDSGFSNLVVDSGRQTSNLLSYTVPASLSTNTQYYVRARHESDVAGLSAWSTPNTFTTSQAAIVAKTGKLTPTNALVDGDHFGRDVSISDDGLVAAVGADQYGSGDGYVDIFKKINGVWTNTQRILASSMYVSGGTDYRWGHALALSGDGTHLVLGNYVYDNYAGVLWIWEDTGSGFVSKANPASPNYAAGNNFGWSVDVSYDGSVIAVGSTGVLAGQGRVYTFQWNGSSYASTGQLGSGTGYNDFFGSEVRLNGDGTRLVVGAFNFRDVTITTSEPTGHVVGQIFVYSWNGSAWVLDDNFGPTEVQQGGLNLQVGRKGCISISTDGNTIVAGGYADHANNYDAAWIYEYQNGSWDETAYINSVSGVDTGLGIATGISGDGNTAYVATIDQGFYTFAKINNAWSEVSYQNDLHSSTPGQSEVISVARTAGTVLVGYWANAEGGFQRGEVAILE